MPVNLPLPDPTKLFPVAGVELGLPKPGCARLIARTCCRFA